MYFIIIFAFLFVFANLFRFYLVKKDILKNLSNVRCNANCYNCGKNLYTNDYEYLVLLSNGLKKSPFSFKKNKISLCKSCNREIKISYLQKKSSYFKIKFKEFILSDLPDKSIFLIIFTFPLLIGSIIIKGRLSDLISTISNFTVILYWTLILIQNFYILKIKTPSESERV
jgi:hypothetical protein